MKFLLLTNLVRKNEDNLFIRRIMKLPKTVIISGYKWNVIQESKACGGSFNNNEKSIYIGSKIDNEKVEIFLHEIIEAILSERGKRYCIYGNGINDRVLFSFYHYEFENIIKDIMCAIKDILKP